VLTAQYKSVLNTELLWTTDDTVDSICIITGVTIPRGLLCGANLWFGGFPYPVNPGRPEWSKVQTRGKPLVATAQAKYMSAGEQ